MPASVAYPVVTSLIEHVADWVQRRRDISEMSMLDAAEFHRIAGELGLAPDELDTLVQRGSHAADEMPKLLRALGFTEEAIAHIQAPQRQDMERECSLCHHKAECGKDLAAGSAAEHYESYCNNADTINELARTLR